MAGRIPQAFIDELIARADIVEIISSRVPLKRAGREYKACCPFHDEKTPSFWVSPDKQFYHCFGCGAHGTALGFLMEYDRLPFPEAVEDLAGRLGLIVPHEISGASAAATVGVAAAGVAAVGVAAADESAPLYPLLERIAQFYASQLPRSGDLSPRRSSASELATRTTPGARCCAASAPANVNSRRCWRPA
jgi:DNA primase